MSSADVEQIVRAVKDALPSDHPHRLHLARHVEIKGGEIKVLKADPKCPYCPRPGTLEG